MMTRVGPPKHSHLEFPVLDKCADKRDRTFVKQTKMWIHENGVLRTTTKPQGSFVMRLFAMVVVANKHRSEWTLTSEAMDSRRKHVVLPVILHRSLMAFCSYSRLDAVSRSLRRLCV